MVPFHNSLGSELRSFLTARHEHAPTAPDHRLFIGLDRVRLPFNTASETLRALFHRAGLKPSAGRIGPRIHDLRHTFAVHRLARWHDAQIDVQARLSLQTRAAFPSIFWLKAVPTISSSTFWASTFLIHRVI